MKVFYLSHLHSTLLEEKEQLKLMTKSSVGIKKIHSQHMNPTNDVVVHIDCSKLNQQNYQVLVKLSEILKDSGEIGEFVLDIFSVKVKNLNTYEKDLIVCKTN